MNVQKYQRWPWTRVRLWWFFEPLPCFVSLVGIQQSKMVWKQEKHIFNSCIRKRDIWENISGSRCRNDSVQTFFTFDPTFSIKPVSTSGFPSYGCTVLKENKHRLLCRSSLLKPYISLACSPFSRPLQPPSWLDITLLQNLHFLC